MQQINVCDLKQGDLVDLQGDKYADPLSNNPSLECELIEVDCIERETADCICVYFEGFDAVGFPVYHKLKIRRT